MLYYDAQLLLAAYSSRAEEEEGAEGSVDEWGDAEAQTWAAWAYSWCVII